MSKKRFSPAYVEHRQRGPFPGQIDPWGEAGRYFQQIHAGMIGDLLKQIQKPLLEMGYEAARETSLQIADQGATPKGQSPELHAIHIRDFESCDLVTIVEIILPNTKSEEQFIADYRRQRDSIIRKKINVIEIDLTRSTNRLVQNSRVTDPFQISIYMSTGTREVKGVVFGVRLVSLALPLCGEVVAMELQAAYDAAYQEAAVAGQIYSEGNYREDGLPFPSMLSDEQRHDALVKVAAWQAELVRLRSG